MNAHISQEGESLYVNDVNNSPCEAQNQQRNMGFVETDDEMDTEHTYETISV